MATEWIDDLRVVDLKEELKKRDLPVSGKKAELVARLTEAVLAEAAPAEEGGAQEEAAEQPQEAEAAAETAAEEPEQQPTPADGAAAEEKQDAAETPAAEVAAPEPVEPASKEAEPEKEAEAEPQKEAEAPAEEAVADSKEEATASQAADPDVDHDAPSTEPEKLCPAEVKEASEPKASGATPVAGKDAKAPAARLPSMQAALLAAQPVTEEADAEMEEAVDFDADMDEDQPEAKPKPNEQEKEEAKEEAQKQPREVEETPEEPDTKRLKQEDGTPASGGRRKREPIPLFKPRERDSTGGGSSAKQEPSADKKLLSDNKKDSRVSVFDRMAGQEAEVPAGKGAPPTRTKATRALLVSGFIRPFTIMAAKNLFNSYGEVENMWMPRIRDKAYVIYKTEEAAEAARQATHGLEWPNGNRTSLRPKFVPVEEAETVINSDGKETLGKPEPAAGKPGINAAAAATAQAAGLPLERRRSDKIERRLTDPKRERHETKPPPKEEKFVGLEDLFRRTEATPHLYWLPLTEEQIAAKRRRQAEAAKQKA